jgi:hypothetical protein
MLFAMQSGLVIIALLPAGRRSDTLNTNQPQESEPIDRPVQWYELALLVIAELLAAAALGDVPQLPSQAAHSRIVEIAAITAAAVLLVVSLWKLLLPPRLSATRGAFVVIGLISIYLLVRH